MAFEGIITSEHKALFKDAIDALLEPTACTVPCKLIYADSKWTDCPNCFTSGTVIKCKNGYKKIEDIAIGDIVYNGTSYTKVNNTSVSLYDGLMHKLKYMGVSHLQYATANHKIPVVRKMRKQFTQKQWHDSEFCLTDYNIEEIPISQIDIGDAVILPIEHGDIVDGITSVNIEGFGDIAVD